MLRELIIPLAVQLALFNANNEDFYKIQMPPFEEVVAWRQRADYNGVRGGLHATRHAYRSFWKGRVRHTSSC